VFEPQRDLNQLTAQIGALLDGMFGTVPPEFAAMKAIADQADALLRSTDAPYHDRDHTLLVVGAGIDLLDAWHQARRPLTSRQACSFFASLFLHDIGYIRGILEPSVAVCEDGCGGTLTPPKGASDAYMAKWHVDRGRQFAASVCASLDTDLIDACIERTRFPVPDHQDYLRTDDLPALCRAADLLGQITDNAYLKKSDALLAELRESGSPDADSHENPAHLRAAFPRFYRARVAPVVDPLRELICGTEAGRRRWARLEWTIHHAN